MENGDQPATKKEDSYRPGDRIVKAFYSFARASDENLKQWLLNATVGERLDMIERRLLDIEERLNMPPQANPPFPPPAS